MDAAAALDAGRTSSRALVEEALGRIGDPAGEGARVFVAVAAAAARAQADAMDALRRAGRAPGPFAGIPISLKDLFDVAGEPTRAGSAVLTDVAPAEAHAAVVARLLAAGFVPAGRTNMTEFAYSGLGINAVHGTPAAPWERTVGRSPGGSSSGAAVSVADGMAFMGLGTDTGGSCRIPAALCGVVGYKPTARRVPLSGVLPLAPSLDSVGPLARSVACCAVTDAVLAAEIPRAPEVAEVAGLRFAVPENVVLDEMDAAVAEAFERALSRLSAAGARVTRTRLPTLDAVPATSRHGGFAAAEAYAWHRALIEDRGDLYDPRIRSRMERGAAQTAADYIDLLASRRRLIAQFDAETAAFDAVMTPTVPLLPPPIAVLDEDAAEYARVNNLLLRNTSYANFLDRCAISLPVSRDPPVGLMLVGETMGDARLFAIAAGVEALLA